ncbi:DUF2934 domain-containing protein [Novispirillum itersonii]|uniref:DUF2934 domain-containing protein n=1 Tax=Novispirillum itersonii TaxID=189 RepID=UPI0009DC23EB|nr:DUF2934 domain-containing protein [Novispirillum itersonii]
MDDNRKTSAPFCTAMQRHRKFDVGIIGSFGILKPETRLPAYPLFQCLTDGTRSGVPHNQKRVPAMADLSHDQIRERAYFLWQQDGQPEGGNDWHYWLLAEQQITGAPHTPAQADAAVPPPEAPLPPPVVKKAGKTTKPAAEPKKAPAKRRSPAKAGPKT